MRSMVSVLILVFGLAMAASGSTDTNCLSGFSWPVGEKVTYRLYWGLIPVGIAVSWTEWVEVEGRRLIAIRLRTTSNKVVEKIYPVDATIESLVDPQSFLPVKFTKNMSEGTHRYHEITVFDHTNRVARWESKITGKTRTFAIEADTHDIPSFMYSMRCRKFEPGKREHFKVMADEKIYDLWLNIQKRETLNLPEYENVACLKLEPEAAFNGLFVRKGRMWAWISDDPRCLAAKMEVNIPVANIRGVLIQVEGPGNDFWVTRKRE
jgi:hypothetical protein